MGGCRAASIVRQFWRGRWWNRAPGLYNAAYNYLNKSYLMKQDPRFPNLFITDHPLIQHKLSHMRA